MSNSAWWHDLECVYQNELSMPSLVRVSTCLINSDPHLFQSLLEVEMH